MIIVEGPDGAGKSRLVAQLAHDLSLPVHERASTSTGGPVQDLWNWACRDVMSWDVQPLAVYDRHPLISEYIYGPIIRGSLPSGFLHPSSRGIMKRVQDRAMVIFALPSLNAVRHNVQDDEVEQLEGVVAKIDSLYWSYRSARANWGGWAVDYDYQEESGSGSYPAVLRAARVHLAAWRKAS